DLSLNRRGHPYEPWFAVLDAVADPSDGTDGPLLGSVANLAIHPVALGPECLAVSADWVAPFRHALAQRTGGHVVMLSGALGDVNPAHVHRQDNDCRADGFGEAAQLGAEVAEAVAGATDGQVVEGPLRVVGQRIIEVPIGGTLL